MNLFLLIKNFSKAKWVFSRPKNRKYLIYDSGIQIICFNT